jgi:hypothetical protein
MPSGWVSLSGKTYGAINMGHVRAIEVVETSDGHEIRVIFDANHSKTLKGDDAARILKWVRHYRDSLDA